MIFTFFETFVIIIIQIFQKGDNYGKKFKL